MIENVMVDHCDEKLWLVLAQLPVEFQREEHYSQPRLLLTYYASGNLCYAS